MTDFDPFDDELGAALRRRAGSGPRSTIAAHDAVLRRAGTIRRRRAAIGGGSAMAVLLFGGIALLPGSGDEIGPLDGDEVLPTFEDSTTTTTEPDREAPESGAAPITVDLTIPDPDSATRTTVVGTQDDDPVPTTGPTPSTSAPSSPSSSTPSTSSTPLASSTTSPTTSSTTSSTSSTSTTSSLPATSVTTAPATTEPEPTLAPFTDTYRSTGGSITVSWNGTALALQSIAPADGFVADVEQSSATRVRVRFEGADDDSRIEVRVDGGVVSVDID